MAARTTYIQFAKSTTHLLCMGALTRHERLLLNSARLGQLSTLLTLLEEGVLINTHGPSGATPLHIAARFGHLQMVSTLISHSADPAARDDNGCTPYDKAHLMGQDEVAKILSRPTHQAISRCRRMFEITQRGEAVAIAELTSTNQELLHIRGPRGATVLHVAARYGHATTVDLLLRLGADTSLRDESGRTAWDKAKQMKQQVLSSAYPAR